MALDVESPNHPDLTNQGTPSELAASEVIGSESDLRREELERFLGDGAWNEAFEEWAEYTDLSQTEYEAILERGLVEQIDFFWDPVETRLRFVIPPVPDEWPDGRDISSKVRTELTDLGQAVIEMLEDGYVDWEDKDRSEKVWSEEKSSEEPVFDQ
ncbi:MULTISPECIES: hypothetical protein [Haloferax]|uniref:DUF7992 domain-containing protein n=2 Tax=Haloferax TaxID=2251 RepID=A0A6G1Z6B3_9EURY|nr:MULTISPECIES: hypothetical protein [Haloferax]KAB1185374.1 hypothetical protein Hfx1149_15060 [Haloferax sp. CBA1149]MRW82015.1 hypothetical protein [Haloferax marinisediminis]